MNMSNRFSRIGKVGLIGNFSYNSKVRFEKEYLENVNKAKFELVTRLMGNEIFARSLRKTLQRPALVSEQQFLRCPYSQPRTGSHVRQSDNMY